MVNGYLWICILCIDNRYLVTWNTVKQAWKKLSKVALDSSSRNLPPKSCMPSRAKMKIKRQSSTNRATMEAIESTRDFTRAPIAFQYLENKIVQTEFVLETVVLYYFVTLNPLRRRIHLSTERPTGGMSSFLTRRYSPMELRTTKKSNLLKRDIM